MDPSLAVKPVVESTNGTLIMSGTLSPIELFAEVVGLDNAKMKVYPAIQDPKKIRTFVDPSLTTTYRYRNEEMILGIGKRIASEILGICNGALIFFPQRGFMNKCLDIWGENGITETKKGLHNLGGKLLFIEGTSAKLNMDRVEKYKSAAVTPKGAILCCVFRGRNSEGSNFPGAQARGIFLVGVPFANFSDPLVRAQINFYNKREQGLGQRWYTMDAFRAANQALGRGIRGVDDWCHYWLLDHRYAERIQLISQWALGNGPELIKN
jgi:Rad3-related DNA helicase